MKLNITGDIDFIAHSAWISTTNEMRANARTREDKERVVRFLVENNHTSPLEGVTLTFKELNVGPDENALKALLSRIKFGRFNNNKLTIDLLNFCKATGCGSEDDVIYFWDAFVKQRQKLGNILSLFGPIQENYSDDVSDALGAHNMSVQLVQLHDDDCGELCHSRASWRIKCPLSISVQILRHRSGSYNQVSGRYRIINEELCSTPQDWKYINEKIGENLSDYMNNATICMNIYTDYMVKVKKSRDNNIITNKEYKRIRELARFILPEGRMTELYVTFYLDDFYNNYLKLRDSEHAQTEHIWVAQEMRKTLEEYQRKNKESD